MNIDWFPLWLSLRVAFLSTALAVAGGLWIAYLLANREFRGKDVLDAAVTLPLVLPPTVLGYYLLVLLGRASPLGKLWEDIFGSPLVFTWKAAVVAALLHALPLLVKSARAALESVDRGYERAARNLGASEMKLVLSRQPAAGGTLHSGGHSAGVRALAGRFRRHTHGGGQHSGQDANRRRRDLRRRGIGQRSSRARAGAGSVSRSAVDPHFGESLNARGSASPIAC